MDCSLRDEHGKKVVQDTRDMTFVPDTMCIFGICLEHNKVRDKPKHSLHKCLEPRPLFCNHVLTTLSCFMAKIAGRAFIDYE